MKIIQIIIDNWKELTMTLIIAMFIFVLGIFIADKVDRDFFDFCND